MGLQSQEPGPGLGMETRAQREGLGPVGDDSWFLFPPLGMGVGKADPKVAGVGAWLQKVNRPLGQTWGSQKRSDRKGIYDAGDCLMEVGGVSSSQGSWGPQAPQTGFDLASCNCSHQSPAVTLGIRSSLLGFLLLDSGDRGRHSKRGGQ